MPSRRSSFFEHPAFGYFISIAAFVFFQVLLWGLHRVAQREFTAENLDPALAGFIDPAFLHARIWLGVSLLFGCFAVRYYNFGQPGRAAAIALTVFIIGLNLLVVFRALQFPICLDDAYIDFRHARNLVLFGSLDYNPGDPVMGFTSHLHLLILTLLGRVVGFEALPLWSQNFNILCDLVSFGLLFQLGRRLLLSPLSATIGSVLLAISLYPFASTTNGKEASLLILLLLLLILSIEAKRFAGVAWTAVLIFLTRPEGALLLGAAGLWCLYVQGWRTIKTWTAPITLAGLWYAVLFMHFGTIWPQGMVAKSVAFLHPTMIRETVVILSFLLNSFGMDSGDQQILTTQNLQFLILLIPLIAWALWRSSGLRFYLGALVLLSVTFVFMRVTMAPFLWYFAWYALAPALVIPFLFEKAVNLTRQAGGFRTMLAAGVYGFVLFIPLGAYPHTTSTILGVRLPYPFFLWETVPQRLLLYERVANRLKTETGGTATVAVCEDGMFGYTYGGPILTVDGLAFKSIGRFYPIPDKMRALGNFTISPKLVLDQKPAYVVFLDAFGRKSLLLDPDFLQQYTLEETLPCTAFGSEALLVYKKNSSSSH